MSQAVDLEVFYPYPPERVWQVLTDRRALAAWMMENTFEPKLEHQFQFYSQSLFGLTTTIHCKVVELEEPTRLVYTWQESPTREPSLVVWTLTAVAGGTQLRLKHHQYSYTPVGAPANRSGITAQVQATTGWLPSGHVSGGRANSLSQDSPLETHSYPPGIATLLSEWPTFTWDYCLNQKLLKVLDQQEEQERTPS